MLMEWTYACLQAMVEVMDADSNGSIELAEWLSNLHKVGAGQRSSLLLHGSGALFSAQRRCCVSIDLTWRGGDGSALDWSPLCPRTSTQMARWMASQQLHQLRLH